MWAFTNDFNRQGANPRAGPLSTAFLVRRAEEG